MKNTVKRFILIALIAVIAVSCTVGLCACNGGNDDGAAASADASKDYSYFDEDVRFKIDKNKFNVMDKLNLTLSSTIFGLAIDNDNTYAEFKTDGTMHFQLQTKETLWTNINLLLNLIPSDSGFNIDQMLSSADLTGMLRDYVEPMFPGFTAKLESEDLKGALELVERSLGLNIVGLNYDNSDVKQIINYIARTKRLPSYLLNRIPKDTVLTLTWDAAYSIKELTAHDGSKYTAVSIGELGRTDFTQPWCVFDMTVDGNGERELFFRAEFMMSQLGLIEIVKTTEEIETPEGQE